MLNIKSSSDNMRILRKGREIASCFDRGIRQANFRIGNKLVRELRRELVRKNKRGRVYIVTDASGRRRRHRSSAAGQTPASITGNYSRNVGYTVRGSKQLVFGVRNGVDYPIFLEKGTSKMAPRPGVTNAVNKTQREASRIYRVSIGAELGMP